MQCMGMKGEAFDQINQMQRVYFFVRGVGQCMSRAWWMLHGKLTCSQGRNCFLFPSGAFHGCCATCARRPRRVPAHPWCNPLARCCMAASQPTERRLASAKRGHRESFGGELSRNKGGDTIGIATSDPPDPPPFHGRAKKKIPSETVFSFLLFILFCRAWLARGRRSQNGAPSSHVASRSREIARETSPRSSATLWIR